MVRILLRVVINPSATDKTVNSALDLALFPSGNKTLQPFQENKITMGDTTTLHSSLAHVSCIIATISTELNLITLIAYQTLKVL